MKLTITTLVIIEGSYIQGIFHYALKEIQNYWNLTSEKVIITDIIPIPQP